MKEVYLVSAAGVSVVCHSRDSAVEWVEWFIANGYAPQIQKIGGPK